MPQFNVPTLHEFDSVEDGERNEFVTGSVTLPANALILACVAYWDGDNVPPEELLGCSGHSLTWTMVNDVQLSSSADFPSRVYLYRASTTSSSSGAITFELSGQIEGMGMWAIVSFTGVDTASNNGIVQSDIGAGTGGSSITTTLDPFGHADNGAFALSFITPNTTGSIAMLQGSGWTELFDEDILTTTPNKYFGFQGQYIRSNDTTVSATFTPSTVRWGIIAVEIKAAQNQTHIKTASNTGTITAAVLRSGSTYKRPRTNSRSSAATMARIWSAKKALSNSRSLVASVTERQTFVKPLTNLRDLTASLARKETARRAAANTRSGDNTPTFFFVRKRNPINSVLTSGLLARNFSSYGKAVANTLATSPALNSLIAVQRLVENEISGSQAVARVWDGARIFVNNISSSSTLARAVEAIRAVANEGEEVAASVIRGVTFVRTDENSIEGDSEVEQSIPHRARTLSNSNELTADVERSKGAARSLTQTGSITASFTTMVAYIRSASHVLETLPVVNRAHGTLRRLHNHRNSKAVLGRLWVKPLSWVGTFSVATPLTDRGYYRLLSNLGTFTDTTDRLITLFKTIYEVRGFNAKLHIMHGFIQTDLSPVVANIRQKVSNFGIFFRPNDAGRQ